LIVSAGKKADAPDALFQLYYTAFFTGLSISFVTFYVTNYFFPPAGAGSYDEYDDWATFTPKEAARINVVPNDNAEELVSGKFGASGYSAKEMKPTNDKLVDPEVAEMIDMTGAEKNSK
jgi:hypothetical protein